LKNTRPAILFFSMVAVMLGFGIIILIIPFYLERCGASGTELGLLMAVFSIMQSGSACSVLRSCGRPLPR
jgi:hypothetical protein